MPVRYRVLYKVHDRSTGKTLGPETAQIISQDFLVAAQNDCWYWAMSLN